jgi:hypothetical protein
LALKVLQVLLALLEMTGQQELLVLERREQLEPQEEWQLLTYKYLLLPVEHGQNQLTQRQLKCSLSVVVVVGVLAVKARHQPLVLAVVAVVVLE